MNPEVSLQATVCFPMERPQADMASKVASEVCGILGDVTIVKMRGSCVMIPDHLQQFHHRDRVKEVQPSAAIKTGDILWIDDLVL